ncbi:MAG: DUF4406 domain-containing protein [Treponema sp.]|nr:DUF4406 domain-containing protein [Treponema sp.]
MKVYLAGPITGHKDYKVKFDSWADIFRGCGFSVMSPAVLPAGFDYSDYMHVDRAMIDTCDGVVFLPGWEKSVGARDEHAYAIDTDRRIFELSEFKSGHYVHFKLEHCGVSFDCATIAAVAQKIAEV